MLYIGFSAYQQGRDPLGDVISRHAAKRIPLDRDKYPYEHCFLMMGKPEIGFHRCELFTTGIGYQWYPPSAEVFPPGIYFRYWHPEKENDAFYRMLDPWTRNECKVSLRHIVRLFKGEVRVAPDISTKGGLFTCTSFVLWLIGSLEYPHRTPELIDFLRSHPTVFGEINGIQSAKEGPAWVPDF